MVWIFNLWWSANWFFVKFFFIRTNPQQYFIFHSSMYIFISAFAMSSSRINYPDEMSNEHQKWNRLIKFTSICKRIWIKVVSISIHKLEEAYSHFLYLGGSIESVEWLKIFVLLTQPSIRLFINFMLLNRIQQWVFEYNNNYYVENVELLFNNTE